MLDVFQYVLNYVVWKSTVDEFILFLFVCLIGNGISYYLKYMRTHLFRPTFPF